MQAGIPVRVPVQSVISMAPLASVLGKGGYALKFATIQNHLILKTLCGVFFHLSKEIKYYCSVLIQSLKETK